MWMTKQFTNKNISSVVSDTQVFIDFILFFFKKRCETAYFWNEKGKSSASFSVPLMHSVPGSVCHIFALHEKWQRWLPKKFHESHETSLVIYYMILSQFCLYFGILSLHWKLTKLICIFGWYPKKEGIVHCILFILPFSSLGL